jgi:preprotein translocase subunit SecB
MSDPQPSFNIEKIYVKDLSVEVPNAPQIFLEREAPSVELQLQTGGGLIADNSYEVLLTVTVTAKLGDKTFFLVEAGQAGIFRIENVPQTDIDPILGIACPNILFPYVRETISDAVNRAGFPPVILSPVNFEMLYQQRLEAEQQQAPATSLQ